MTIELDRLKKVANIARLVCLKAMDRRSTHALKATNIYFKALHLYRVELRRQRMKEKIVVQASLYPAPDYNEGGTDWGCGPYLTPKGESK